jgi:hypothetical protein
VDLLNDYRNRAPSITGRFLSADLLPAFQPLYKPSVPDARVGHGGVVLMALRLP